MPHGRDRARAARYGRDSFDTVVDSQTSDITFNMNPPTNGRLCGSDHINQRFYAFYRPESRTTHCFVVLDAPREYCSLVSTLGPTYLTVRPLPALRPLLCVPPLRRKPSRDYRSHEV